MPKSLFVFSSVKYNATDVNGCLKHGVRRTGSDAIRVRVFPLCRSLAVPWRELERAHGGSFVARPRHSGLPEPDILRLGNELRFSDCLSFSLSRKRQERADSVWLPTRTTERPWEQARGRG